MPCLWGNQRKRKKKKKKKRETMKKRNKAKHEWKDRKDACTP